MFICLLLLWISKLMFLKILIILSKCDEYMSILPNRYYQMKQLVRTINAILLLKFI